MTSPIVESINKALGQGRGHVRLRSPDGKFRNLTHKGAVQSHATVPRKVKAIIEKAGGKAKPQVGGGGAVVAVFESHEKALEARTALMLEGYRVVQHDIPGVLFIDAGKGISESCAAPEVKPASGGRYVTDRYGRHNGSEKGRRQWHIRGNRTLTDAGHEGHFIAERGDGQFAVVHRRAVENGVKEHTLYTGNAHEVANVADLVCAALARSAAIPNTAVHLGQRADGSHAVVATLPAGFRHIQTWKGGKPLNMTTEAVTMTHVVKISANQHPSAFAAENEMVKHVSPFVKVDGAGRVDDDSGVWHAFKLRGADITAVKASLAKAGVKHAIVGESLEEAAKWAPSKDSVFANRMEMSRTPDVIDASLKSLLPGQRKFNAKVQHDPEVGSTAITVPLKHAAEARQHVARALSAGGEHDAEIRQNSGHPDNPKMVTFHVLHHNRIKFQGHPRLHGDTVARKVVKVGGKMAKRATAATLKLVNKLHAAAQSLSESGDTPINWSTHEDAAGQTPNASETGAYGRTSKPVDVPVHEFLRMNPQRKMDDRPSGNWLRQHAAKGGAIAHPMLYVAPHEERPGEYIVTGHEGRGRAMLAGEYGHTHLPIKIRFSDEAGRNKNNKLGRNVVIHPDPSGGSGGPMTVHIPPHPEAMNEDQLPGGKGDNVDLSKFDPTEVEMGLKVEMEHTNDKAIAAEITADHLSEDPRYYTKLKAAGLADEMKGTK